MNWKDVPLPPLMKERCLIDPRGFPIPYIILRDDNGVYHFKINDEHKRMQCIENRLCAICGASMGDDFWLVGGPLSAFHPRGAYNDSALHYECAAYALQVCPYLAARSYNTVEPEVTLGKVESSSVKLFVDPTIIMDRPSPFVLVKVRDWTLRHPDSITTYIKPDRPYLEIEFWDKGTKLEFKDVRIEMDDETLAGFLECVPENIAFKARVEDL